MYYNGDKRFNTNETLNDLSGNDYHMTLYNVEDDTWDLDLKRLRFYAESKVWGEVMLPKFDEYTVIAKFANGGSYRSLFASKKDVDNVEYESLFMFCMRVQSNKSNNYSANGGDAVYPENTTSWGDYITALTPKSLYLDLITDSPREIPVEKGPVVDDEEGSKLIFFKGKWGGTTQYATGGMYWFRLYNRILTLEQIQEIVKEQEELE